MTSNSENTTAAVLAPSNGDTTNNKVTMTLSDALAASSKIRPSTIHTTTDCTAAVQLRTEEYAAIAVAAKDTEAAEYARLESVSLPSLLNRTTLEFPDTVALRFQRMTENQSAASTEWNSVTYKEYQANVLRSAKIFLKLGLDAHNSVGVLAFNSPEWFYSCLGAVHAGGIIAGIYTTNSPDAVLHVLRSSRANIVVVDDAKQMAKIRQIRDQLPLLRAAIQTMGPYEDYVNGTDGYYRWSELFSDETIAEEQEQLLIERLANIRVNECCSLVYTSGTVGEPKGVMLSHDSLTWASRCIGQRLPNLNPGHEVIISYLPLSHIAAQVIDVLVCISFGVTVYFADKDALKGSLIKTLHAARPTRFIGVPRVYEKINEKLRSVAAQTTGIRRTIATWAKGHTLQHWLDAIDGRPTDTFQYRAARYLIMGRIKEALGLDRCLSVVTAAAPMLPELKHYFMSIDLPVVEGFGMSESAGPHCVGTVDRFSLESVGQTLSGAETRLDNCDADGQGEILMRGRHVFMGYIDEPTKTAEALTEDGWLRTGDLGTIDENGLVFVTGRLKELIITAGGENVPPTPIENLLRKELGALSNAFLVGDRRKFLTMLVTLKTEMDAESGQPKDELLPETREWLRELGVDYRLLSEVLAAGPCPKVLDAITAAVGRANKLATSNAQRVQKFAILPHDFSVPTGELGPTLKVKRSVVAKMYADLIDSLYVD